VAGERFVHVAHLEGLAAIGRLKRFRVEECGSSRRKRIVAETVDGETLVTRCIDYRGVKKVVYYLSEAKRLSGLVVSGPHVDFEEVFEEEPQEDDRG
jgi:hypothetical protein